MKKYPTYSVAIRTLGTAGAKYLATLESVQKQILQPERILVYLPEKYPPPRETIGIETILRCKKGMVAQRCLDLKEIPSEFILFLDDDVEFEADFVKILFDGVSENEGDCIAPDIFKNTFKDFKVILREYFTGGTRPHFFHKNWAFIIHADSHFSYNNHPTEGVLLAQSAAGPCSLWRKSAYESIHFEAEQWIDQFHYALGDDQLFFYKLYRRGYRILISYDAKAIHLDGQAGHSVIDFWAKEYSFAFLRYMLWYRTIYEVQTSIIKKCLCAFSFHVLDFVRSLPLKLWFLVRHGTFRKFSVEHQAYFAAKKFTASEEYKKIPKFC